MATPRALKFRTWLLAGAFLCSLVLTGYLLYQNIIWRFEATQYAESAARSAAHATFRKGSLVLYKIEGECDQDRFSGTREEPFEIWIKFYQPVVGSAHRQTTERWVEAFNDQMRRMQKEPEKFRKRLGADQ